MDPISVLLVDDNPIFLNIATRFLQSYHDLIVVGTAADGQEALARAQKLHPQLILLDLALPDLSGLELIPHLRNLLPYVNIIVLTLQEPASYQAVALAAGADGFVSKATLIDELLPSIHRVMQLYQTSSNKKIK